MKSCLRTVLLLFLVSGTLTQEVDLADALDDSDPIPKPGKPVVKPPKTQGGGGGIDIDLEDLFGPDPVPKHDKPLVKPPNTQGGDDGFVLDLGDVLSPDHNPKPDKPAVNPPPSGGGGGDISDSDLFDIAGGGGGGDYRPDRGHAGGGDASNLAGGVGADCNKDVIQKLEEAIELLKANCDQCSARSN